VGKHFAPSSSETNKDLHADLVNTIQPTYLAI
jgi:hypothetical protein